LPLTAPQLKISTKCHKFQSSWLNHLQFVQTRTNLKLKKSLKLPKVSAFQRAHPRWDASYLCTAAALKVKKSPFPVTAPSPPLAIHCEPWRGSLLFHFFANLRKQHLEKGTFRALSTKLSTSLDSSRQVASTTETPIFVRPRPTEKIAKMYPFFTWNPQSIKTRNFEKKQTSGGSIRTIWLSNEPTHTPVRCSV
jgi:hypothetical protein